MGARGNRGFLGKGSLDCLGHRGLIHMVILPDETVAVLDAHFEIVRLSAIPIKRNHLAAATGIDR